MRYLALTVLALSFVSTKPVIGAETKSTQQYLVKVVLGEIPVARLKQPGTILAQPQVMVVAGREAALNIGGESKFGENKIPVGTLFKVNVSQIDDKKVRVTGMLEASSVGALDDGLISRESFSIHFDKTVDLGNKARFCVSKSSDRERWFELLVDEPNNLHAGNSAAQPSAATLPAPGSLVA